MTIKSSKTPTRKPAKITHRFHGRSLFFVLLSLLISAAMSLNVSAGDAIAAGNQHTGKTATTDGDKVVVIAGLTTDKPAAAQNTQKSAASAQAIKAQAATAAQAIEAHAATGAQAIKAQAATAAQAIEAQPADTAAKATKEQAAYTAKATKEQATAAAEATKEQAAYTAKATQEQAGK